MKLEDCTHLLYRLDIMEFTVYKKSEEVDEYVGKGAKKKKNKNSKEPSPGK